MNSATVKHHPYSNSKAGPSALKWTFVVGVAAVVAIGLVLLFLLTQATDQRALYEQNYGALFLLNVVVAAMLLVVILWVTFKLFVRYRKRRFGSRLLVKLAGIFALAGFVPGVLIYVVSYQFVSRSIESWFDVKVEAALEAGLNLGRSTLDALASDLAAKTKAASAQLAQTPDTIVGVPLDRIREQLGASDVILWGASGQLIGSAGDSKYQINPVRPTQQQFRSARSVSFVTWIDGLDDLAPEMVRSSNIKVLAMVQSPSVELRGEARYLQVIKPLSPALVANALAVAEANREYQERSLARSGLQRMYIGTLTLSLFLAVFGAVILAVLLGNQIVRPLLLLADGVSKVAAGDLTPKVFLQANDELGGLTRAFADMTRQLHDARQAVESSMVEVNGARASLQTILDNLTAGVVVLNPLGHIISANPGASKILQRSLNPYVGAALSDVPGLTGFASRVRQNFDDFSSHQSDNFADHWQASFDLDGKTEEIHMTGQHAGVVIMARGAILPTDDLLLVFDDITSIISAQRAQAWGEVARRLAHEIKNPLTPIQLSAERLEMKLTGKVSAAEQAILSKSVRTIVDQVDAMKRLVNEFRDYARLPAAKLVSMDLNTQLIQVLQLYENEIAGNILRMNLDERCKPIAADPQQMTQVIHNLVQNALDANLGGSAEASARLVEVSTRWIEGKSRVALIVTDEGPGFPDHVLKRAFEPYVTTKARGTGLGLAVVKKIVDEHGATIKLTNRTDGGVSRGATVTVNFRVADGPRGEAAMAEQEADRVTNV